MTRRPRGLIGWDHLNSTLTEMEIEVTTNAGVHDCSPLIRALAPVWQLLGETILVGFYQLPGSSHPSLVRSASFLIKDNSFRTLELHTTEYRDNRPQLPQELAEAILPDNPARISIELEHVYCRFTPVSAREEEVDSLTRLANLYQRFLLDSRNFENFMDGRIYFLARPDKHGELHPRFRSFHEIADALRREFSVNAEYVVFTGSRDPGYRPDPSDFPSSENKSLNQILPFSADQVFVWKLGRAVVYKQSIVGSVDTDWSYSIHPASDSTRRQSPVEGLMIIWDAKPISVMCYRAAATWLRDFSARRHLEQTRFLQDLRLRVEERIKKSSPQRVWGREARRLAVEEMAQHVCEQLCRLTNAESASFRLVSYARGVAQQCARFETALGRYGSVLRAGAMAPDILLSNWEHSAVAFAFKSHSPEAVLYIGDMSRLPEEYLKQGLQRVLLARPTSRSEAVIRIKQGGLLAAVINLESPVEGALQNDLEFFRDCSEVVSDYMTRLDTFGDRTALAEIAGAQIAAHAVKSFVAKWTPGDAEGAQVIASRLKSHLFGKARNNPSDYVEFAGKMLSISGPNACEALLNAFHEWIADCLRRATSEVSSHDILLGNIPSGFAIADLPSLAVIFDSIWTNVLKFPKPDINVIKLAAEERAPFSTQLFTITWSAPNSLDSAVNRDLIFLRPPDKSIDSHFGFVLVGVHTRLLGGQVELVESHGVKGFTVRIYIPYQTSQS